MAKAINWKKRALAAEAALTRARAYAFDYGNADYECPSGYLQQRDLICHKCGFDGDSRNNCGLKEKRNG